jgi:acetylornithine deacetylase
MSTEINLDELYNNSVKILTDLIGFRTISGEDNSALINYCENSPSQNLEPLLLKHLMMRKKKSKSFCYYKSKKN